MTAAIESVEAEAAAADRGATDYAEPVGGIAAANGQPAPVDIDPKVSINHSELAMFCALPGTACEAVRYAAARLPCSADRMQSCVSQWC